MSILDDMRSELEREPIRDHDAAYWRIGNSARRALIAVLDGEPVLILGWPWVVAGAFEGWELAREEGPEDLRSSVIRSIKE